MNDILNWLKDRYKEVKVLEDGSVAAIGDRVTARIVYIGLRRYGYQRKS